MNRKHNKSIVKSTIHITILSFVRIVLSLVTQLVVAYFFGTTTERDAYFATTIIPTYLSSIIMGSIGVVFLPMYVDSRQKQNEHETDRFWYNVLTFSTSIAIVIAVVVAVFAKEVMSMAAPGFEGAQLALSAELMFILLPTVVFQINTNITGAVLQTQHRFIIPALGPVVSSIIMFFTVVLFHSALGIHSLAYGTLVGSIVNWLLVRWAVHKPLRVVWSIRGRQVRELLKVSAPLLAGGMIVRLSGVFERGLASMLPESSISYLGYAHQMMAILSAIIAGGIVTAIYPLLSKAWSEHDFGELNRLFAKGIRCILIIAMPVTVVLIFWGAPIIQILLERGAFTHEATVAVSTTLAILAGAFLANCVGGLISNMIYLSRKTFFGTCIGIMEFLVYLTLAYSLLHSFSYKGLALASSISTLTCAVGGFIFITHTLRLHVAALLKDVTLIVIAAIAPVVALHLALQGCGVDTGVVSYWIIFACGLFIFAYYGLLRAFRIEDVNFVLQKRAWI